ncbi:Undecaprenyl phosphate-aminoarabinose flippase subunit ArnE [Pseudomonas chlororaphis subsp. aurantiaca]|uniref:Probable 4-amino-4-deoxy-L-arabinose-phosphoundecaprenol flippase subunit ArnE n=1 Tax=Pseudomonas chlororaphis subsp. aurantiaca TaxID=86192 RepID=A0AAJ1E1E5_9PSED|nr:4-amino-4-deoxy-L-arabinose-phosphoundecaprenol flippase subunit ArnE [Pseudomonas chlororaphis]AZD22306.1 Undecaprenyl phosphate-aminoarabinose flippase subunit ArnE [Pseudomonas chlororaphis subsp. aurantiaca]AZD35879.1 Undecaprenyl phosphate-aminoarabinose flippase subunit ArnE [Pseudomonas chlororaphis subsp. aurantiaca]AZD42216.1 Undecaprenyl phosphate-aminoarabinose flippase subunit ArnE [Pseudomonas chlororaphis subsp. aurantiaca]AZD48439.1 Undecaprenyl phosphate-aminoarabinose flippa
MSLLLLLVACLLTCLGQIAQKFAVESWRGQPSGALAKLRSPWLWLALASLGLGLLVWLLVLQRVEVGIAYPMLSLNFVLITLIARFVFHEAIDRRHWLGVALVLAGVLLLSRHA